jgi:hypothetical protein
MAGGQGDGPGELQARREAQLAAQWGNVSAQVEGLDTLMNEAAA